MPTPNGNTTTSLSAYPTVILGLGGLGGYIVREMHRKDPGPHCTYIILDTDAPKVEHGEVVYSGLTDLDAVDNNLQIVRMAGVDLAEWRSTWPDILDGIFPTDLPANLASGAAKRRLYGSAAGWECAEEIYRTVQSSMRRVRQLEGVDNRVLRIRLVCGTSGGTGSANILKAAMLAHQAYADTWDKGQVSIEIQPYLVLPDCYNVDSALRKIVEVNGAWCLRELAHAQREGMTLVFPRQGGGWSVSVPPGFLQKAVCIGASSVVRDITEVQALEQMAMALYLESGDPAIGKAIRDEDIDILGDVYSTNYERFVGGVAAHIVRVSGSAELARLLWRRRVAVAFNGLPNLPANTTSDLANSVLPVSFRELSSVDQPALSLEVNEVVNVGGGVVAMVSNQETALLDQYRMELRGRLTGGISVVEAVRGFVVANSGRHNLRSISQALQTWIRSLSVPAPADADARFRSEVGGLVTQMEDANELAHRPATFGEMLGSIFGKGKPTPEQSAESIASTIIGRCFDHFERLLTRTQAEVWNAHMAAINREVMVVVAEIERASALIQAEARQVIEVPEVVPTGDYTKTITVRVEDVERQLPSVNCQVVVMDGNILTDTQQLFVFGGSVSDEEIMLHNPSVISQLDELLRGVPYLSYNAARCDGKPSMRVFVSGPAGIKAHPRLRELNSRRELRWVEDLPDGEIRIVMVLYGVKPGAIAGVDTWEKRIVGGDNTFAVSSLQFLRLPALVQIREELVIEPFVISLVAGQQLPTVGDDSWSCCSPDAVLRRKVKDAIDSWLFYPYPGKGRQPEMVGHSLTEAFDAFKLDLGECRTMATARTRDLAAANGWPSLQKQVQRFYDRLGSEVTSLATEIGEAGTPDDPSALRELHTMQQRYEELHWLYQAIGRWLTEKARTLKK